MSNLCENEKKYNQIALACKEKAKEYDINIMAEKYNQLYHEHI